MKNLFIIFVMFLGLLDLHAQDSNIILSCRISYLPSSSCRYEYYIQNGQIVKHWYEKESDNCFQLNFINGRKINSIDLVEVSKFISKIKGSDTLKIKIPRDIKKSLPHSLLKNSGYFQNNTLTLLFKEFETEYYKPYTMPERDAVQIDGNFLSAYFIQNQDTLLTVHKGYFGFTRVSDFKEWVTLYLIYHKYGLFKRLMVDPYLSKKNLIHMIRQYLETMKN